MCKEFKTRSYFMSNGGDFDRNLRAYHPQKTNKAKDNSQQTRDIFKKRTKRDFFLSEQSVDLDALFEQKRLKVFNISQTF